jgi:hypothetical protein
MEIPDTQPSQPDQKPSEKPNGVDHVPALPFTELFYKQVMMEREEKRRHGR